VSTKHMTLIVSVVVEKQRATREAYFLFSQKCPFISKLLQIIDMSLNRHWWIVILYKKLFMNAQDSISMKLD
jgi:hypothetical protein